MCTEQTICFNCHLKCVFSVANLVAHWYLYIIISLLENGEGNHIFLNFHTKTCIDLTIFVVAVFFSSLKSGMAKTNGFGNYCKSSDKNQKQKNEMVNILTASHFARFPNQCPRIISECCLFFVLFSFGYVTCVQRRSAFPAMQTHPIHIHISTKNNWIVCLATGAPQPFSFRMF